MGFFKRKERKILVFGPQKGQFAYLMEETIKGVSVGEKIFGNDGLKIFYEDSGWSVDEIYSKLTFLLSRNKYDIVISPVFSVFVPSASAAAEKFETPLLLTIASVPFIPKISRYSITLIYTDEDQAKAMVDFAKKYYHTSSITLIFYSKYKELSVMADTINKRAMEKGIKVKQIFKKEKEDVPFDLLQREWIMEADVVIILGARKGVSNVNEIIKKSEKDVKIIANDYICTCKGKDLEKLNGVTHTTAYFPKESLEGVPKRFLEVYLEKYEEEPSFIAAMAFDAYSVAWNVLKSSIKKEYIINEIKSDREFPGSFDKFLIEKSGRTKRKVLFIKIENGKKVYEGGIEYE